MTTVFVPALIGTSSLAALKEWPLTLRTKIVIYVDIRHVSRIRRRTRTTHEVSSKCGQYDAGAECVVDMGSSHAHEQNFSGAASYCAWKVHFQEQLNALSVATS